MLIIAIIIIYFSYISFSYILTLGDQPEGWIHMSFGKTEHHKEEGEPP